ncbi:MAG: nuclear transport factor 2 family protein [Gammaproteobacteria bacterium]|nr:nuclear transport factor 2 family protein [Gammaproteobacteria bacterium]
MADQDRLQALLDREAIRDLPLRYCDCVWRDDIDGLIKLFAKDGEFAISHLGTESGAAGHPALRKFYREGLKIGPRPFIHNHVVTLDDNSHASGRCYLALHSINSDMQFIGAGYYADTYVKTKRDWKFQRRHFTAVRFDETPVTVKPKSKPEVSKKRA